jgi:ATP-dependent helicase HepA
MRLQFPELPDEGLTVTLDRPTALAREEVVFLTWEHPMVRDAMDLIQNHEHGNASLAILHHDDLEPGQLLIECYHVIESSAPRRLHVGRFFPPRLIRTLVEASGEDLSQLREEDFVGIHRHFDREHAVELLRNQRKSIERGLKVAERRIAKLLPGVVAEGTQRMLDAMTVELKRLAALRKVNPTVRQEELDQMKSLALDLHASIQASRSRLDSIRVIITA